MCVEIGDSCAFCGYFGGAGSCGQTETGNTQTRGCNAVDAEACACKAGRYVRPG
jgi:hypothetical protein